MEEEQKILIQICMMNRKKRMSVSVMTGPKLFHHHLVNISVGSAANPLDELIVVLGVPPTDVG